jgi:GNAT superfamily N-acetyltransferase
MCCVDRLNPQPIAEVAGNYSICGRVAKVKLLVFSVTKILNADSVPAALLHQLREWLEAEWGHIDPFEGNYPEVTIPSPLVAVDEQSSLLGGLIFGSFAKPGSSEIAVWVNAVLISPTQRKKGIASQLLQRAEVEAKRFEISELFVLSEYPELYSKLGWQYVGLDSSRNETILTKRLVSA